MKALWPGVPAARDCSTFTRYRYRLLRACPEACEGSPRGVPTELDDRIASPGVCGGDSPKRGMPTGCGFIDLLDLLSACVHNP